MKNRGDRAECLLSAQVKAYKSSLLLFILTFPLFSLSEFYVCEHFDSEESDNLRTNGDYNEFTLCSSFFH